MSSEVIGIKSAQHKKDYQALKQTTEAKLREQMQILHDQYQWEEVESWCNSNVNLQNYRAFFYKIPEDLIRQLKDSGYLVSEPERRESDHEQFVSSVKVDIPDCVDSRYKRFEVTKHLDSVTNVPTGTFHYLMPGGELFGITISF